MIDDFYNYTSTSRIKIVEMLESWDGGVGLHGDIMKECIGHQMGDSILDVGCGGCHLHELTHEEYPDYVGVDAHPLMLEWARAKYPGLEIHEGSVYDLSMVGNADTVYAIGLYNSEPKDVRGIDQMVKHANKCVILTYRNPVGFMSSLGYHQQNFLYGDFTICKIIKGLR